MSTGKPRPPTRRAARFEALVDPRTSASDAAHQVRHIAIDTFDQGCCDRTTPRVVGRLVAALAHAQCRAPAAILRALGNYLYRNAEQRDAGSARDDIFDGFDSRAPRWALFDDDRYPFLRDLHRAVSRGTPHYIEHLAHPDPDVREAAAYVLSARLEDRIRERLAERLEVESDDVALAATILAYALHARYSEAPLDILARFATDDRPAVSAAACIALVNGDPDDAEPSHLARLAEARRSPRLVWDRSEHGVTLGGKNLQLAASRALSRATAGTALHSELDDHTIIEHDTFLDKTVARIAAEAAVARRRPPADLARATGELRALLVELVARPAAFSRAVTNKLGGDALHVARALGLRPPPALDQSLATATVAEVIVDSVVGDADLAAVAARLAGRFPGEDALDLIEDMLHQDLRRRIPRAMTPAEATWQEGQSFMRENDRRLCRLVLLGLELALIAGSDALPALRSRAQAAIGDRIGGQLHRPVFVTAAARLGAASPVELRDCVRTFKLVAGYPELAGDIRSLLEATEIEHRFGVVTGYYDVAYLYVDLLDRDGLLGIARSYNLLVEERHVIPYWQKLRVDDPALADELVDALLERQADGGFYRFRPGSTRRSFDKADGSTVELWTAPTPPALSELPALEQ